MGAQYHRPGTGQGVACDDNRAHGIDLRTYHGARSDAPPLGVPISPSDLALERAKKTMDSSDPVIAVAIQEAKRGPFGPLLATITGSPLTLP